MIINKTNIIILLVGIFLGLCTGFFTGKALYDKPFDVGIKTDTVTIHDTIPDISPVPKDSVRTKWLTRWLPAKHDTITQWMTLTKHDSVAVQVPITSKHYGNETYDAWVSGFETNLDSIFVYNETQLITETITRMKPPNKWELDLFGGIKYDFNKKKLTPFAGGELLYKPCRLEFGIRGGIEYQDNADTFVDGVIKYRLY